MKKIKKLTLVMMLLISIILLTCCKSIPKNEVRPFPNPIVDGEPVVTFDGETVSMPLWYWLAITEYVIEVEERLTK